MGVPVIRPRHTEAASLAAAILVATSVGLVRDPEATARARNPAEDLFTPDAEAAVFYRERRLFFDDLYTALLPLYGRLHGA